MVELYFTDSMLLGAYNRNKQLPLLLLLSKLLFGNNAKFKTRPAIADKPK